MLKRQEKSYQTSCFNRAGEDEMLFILLARDPAAPGAIRWWASERIRLGKNQPEDQQIKEALACADEMEEVRSAG